MTPAQLFALLQEFYRETLDLFEARQANSRYVAGYDANNAYQQVIGRQDVHLQWLADAMAALGSAVPETRVPAGVPDRPREDERALIEADIRAQSAFLDRWLPRVGTVSNARHRKLLSLILGEMKEHLRALQQAAEGRSDVLGRHSEGKIPRGKVLPARPQN